MGMRYQTEAEFVELLEIYKKVNNKKFVLEIGSLVGETLRHWINDGESGMTLLSIDLLVAPWDGRYTEQKQGHDSLWAQWAKDKQINLTVMNLDSTQPQTVAKVKSLVPYLDFLLIDGGHDYGTVTSDYRNYGPLVRSGGVIAFHDVCGYAEVKQCWDEVKGRGPSKEIHTENGWGIGVLYV